MAEREPWELSNEESFSRRIGRDLGRRFCLSDDGAFARKLRAGTGRSSIASLRGRRIWWAHLPLSRNLVPFPGTPLNDRFLTLGSRPVAAYRRVGRIDRGAAGKLRYSLRVGEHGRFEPEDIRGSNRTRVPI